MATRVLIVDDNPQDRLLARRALLAEFPDLEAIEAIDQSQLDAALAALDFDVVITDYQLRWSDGLKVLQQVHQVAPDMPVIMFTNTGSEEIAASGLRMNLADYIVKSAGHYGRLAHGVRVALRNIAVRREMEAQLAERSQLLELSYEPIFAWALDGGITEWNAGCERLYGYSREEAIGRVSHELLRTTARIPIPELVERLRTERRWTGEVGHVTKDGRQVIVESRLQRIDLGEHELVLESNRDVTDRKRHAERTAFMSEASVLLAASLDYETTLTAVANLAVPRLADACAVDIVNSEGAIERLAVAHVDPAAPRLSVISQTETVASVIRTSMPVLEPSANGEMGITSCICVPLVAHGRTLGALTFATAESQRRYSQDDLLFAEQIGHRAALAVDNAQAYQAMQVADRLKDEFLATLSHELRTPLNAILGYARLLRSGTMSSDKTARAVEIVERNAASLTKLVEDVLDVSRIISGKVRLTIQPVDLPAIVQTALETLMPAADAKRIEVRTAIDPHAGLISGDPDRLPQIVWNLVSNAVKFTPPGGRIEIRVERVDGAIDLIVSDTGVGIKPEFLPHMFERFRQGEGAATRRFGGLGLGLAIVRHLVELHGGTVEATSAGEGAGATFRVRLPLLAAQPSAAVAERRSRAHDDVGASPPAAGRLAHMHVLAVDDDPDALALIREILEFAGARVTALESSQAALALLPGIQPDVLVADVGLKDIDGFELLRRVRELPEERVRHVPAIALTAYARSTDRVRALESGFSMHVAKPADPAELVAAIIAVARQRHRA